MQFIIRLLINAVALAAAERLIDGIDYTGQWVWLIAVALIFGLVNATIGPLLKLLTCPLILLTLGLFTLVINGLMLLLTSWLSRQIGCRSQPIGGRGPAAQKGKKSGTRITSRISIRAVSGPPMRTKSRVW